MELYFLGTGAGMPSKRRNVTSLVLDLSAERGTVWMFDCGEGTQHQILSSPVKLSKLEKVFITHLHGDHIYGLPGMLSSRSYQGGDTPLTLYGPKGIRAFIETAFRISESYLTYPIEYVEFESNDQLFEDEQFIITTAKLDHRIDSFGFRIVEKEEKGTLLTDKLRELGVTPGPVYGQIKQGGPVTLPNGSVINGEDFVGPSIPGRIVTVLGDTKPCEGSLELAKEATVLIHEATFIHNLQEMADKYNHSTSVEAATIAKQAGAKSLILTHISSRYGEEEAVQLLDEAKEVFPDTYMAHDFWSFDIPRLKAQ